jgi:hypothetical protein
MPSNMNVYVMEFVTKFNCEPTLSSKNIIIFLHVLVSKYYQVILHIWKVP